MTNKSELVRDLQKNEHVLCIVPLNDLIKEFQAQKDTAKNLSGLVSPVMDAVTAGKLLKELGASPDKVVFKHYQGTKYVIFKGHPGKRSIFKGTRYLTTNPLIVRMAIGPTGIKNSVKAGFVISVVMSTTIEVFNYFISKTTLLPELLGTITADLTKAALSSVAAATVALKIGSAAIIGGAAAPIIVAIVVGLAANWILNRLDERYGVTKALIAAYEDIGIEWANIKNGMQREFKQATPTNQQLMCYFKPCYGPAR